MYEFGEGVEKDLAKAVELYQASADQNDSTGQWRLGYMYEYGDGIEKDFAKAVELYQDSAEQGNAEGQRCLGVMYYNGMGVEKDYNKALDLFQSSAEQGNAEGQRCLGVMYDNGVVVNKDYNKALDLFQSSAEQGNAEAQYCLGMMYYNGRGVEKDYNKALDLFQSSAEQGNSDATNAIGCIFENSNNYTQAIHWYKKGEILGNVYSMANLGQLYEKGLGVERSKTRAVEFYQKACNSGENICAAAAYLLGYAYYDGEGVKQNKATALEYFQKAYDNGYPCSYAIDMLNNELNKNRKAADNPMRDYANNIISKNLPIKKMYPLVLKDLRKDFGPAWETLQPNSQKFLSTSMVCYIALYSMGGPIYGNMDFTSCITPMFKALETELGKYLYTGYINYLNENKIPVSAFKSKRSFIVLVGEDGPYSTEFTYRDPDDLEHFTLGSLHLVIGMDRKTQGRKGLIEITDTKTKRRESIMIDEGEFNRSSIDPTMLDYAKSIFDEDVFGNVDLDRAITDYLVDLATEIKTITDSFRNPAAHANVMSYEKAETCANYLIKAKKLICKFVEKIKK